MKITTQYLYSGMGDYFGGYGCKANEALLYAFYGHRTTLRDIIEGWVEDSWSGAACEDIPESVSEEDVRKALLEMLTDAGRADYDSNAIAECAAMIETPCCPDCGALVDDEHYDSCDEAGVVYGDYESPICVVIMSWEEEDV
jgi:hypothetical protein